MCTDQDSIGMDWVSVWRNRVEASAIIYHIRVGFIVRHSEKDMTSTLLTFETKTKTEIIKQTQ